MDANVPNSLLSDRWNDTVSVLSSYIAWCVRCGWLSRESSLKLCVFYNTSSSIFQAEHEVLHVPST